MARKPKDWKSFVGGGTSDALRATRICHCPACKRDGQHEPMCAVHLGDWENGEELPCDCDRKPN